MFRLELRNPYFTATELSPQSSSTNDLAKDKWPSCCNTFDSIQCLCSQGHFMLFTVLPFWKCSPLMIPLVWFFFLLYLLSILLNILGGLLIIHQSIKYYFSPRPSSLLTHTHTHHMPFLSFKSVHPVSFYTSSPGGRSHSAETANWTAHSLPSDQPPKKHFFLQCSCLSKRHYHLSHHLIANPGKHHQHLLTPSQMSSLDSFNCYSTLFCPWVLY